MSWIVAQARTPARTCGYCRADVAVDDPECGCGAVYHADCRAALGRCATLGCGAVPAPVASRRRPRLTRSLAGLASRSRREDLLLLAVLLLGLGMAARLGTASGVGGATLAAAVGALVAGAAVGAIAWRRRSVSTRSPASGHEGDTGPV